MPDETPFPFELTGATRLYPIVGDPIAQVKAPTGVTRTLREAGRNAACVPVHVAPADLPGVMEGFRLSRNVDGVIVTVPHKFAVAAFCATLSERSRFLGAVNVLRRDGEGWYGDQTDGIAFVRAQLAAGCTLRGRTALLVGAGGAGSAIAHALLEAGVASLAIHDGDAARRDDLVARLAALGLAPVTAGSADPTGYGFVANASPMGMKAGDPLPILVERLSPETWVGDVVTMPAVPPLIEAARAAGCGTATGTDMFNQVAGLLVDVLLER